MRIITNCVMLETGGTRRKTQETQGKTGRNTTGFLPGSYVRMCVRPCTRERTHSCVRIRPRRGIHPPGRKSFRAGPSPTSTGLVCEKNSPISVHRNTHAQRQPETVSRWAFSCYPKPDFCQNKDPSGAARGVVLCPGYGLGFYFTLWRLCQTWTHEQFARSGCQITQDTQDPAGSQQLPGPTVSPLVLPDRPGCPGSRRRAAAARAYRVPAGAAGSPRMPRIPPDRSSCQGPPWPHSGRWICLQRKKRLP